MILIINKETRSQMGKRGPTPQPGLEQRLELSASDEVVAALDRLKRMSGLSRATLIRAALTEHLISAGVLPESARDNVALAKATRQKHNNQ